MLRGASLAYDSPVHLQSEDKRKHTGAGRRCWKPRPSSSSAPHCHEETVHHCRRQKEECEITEISQLGMESCVMNLHTHNDPKTQLVKWHSLTQVSQFTVLWVWKAQCKSHSALLNIALYRVPTHAEQWISMTFLTVNWKGISRHHFIEMYCIYFIYTVHLTEE